MLDELSGLDVEVVVLLLIENKPGEREINSGMTVVVAVAQYPGIEIEHCFSSYAVEVDAEYHSTSPSPSRSHSHPQPHSLAA